MRFDLADLRLFLSVVEHGSLTRGARAVNLALASASERISGMEAVLGAQLLERTPRGALPTAAGDCLIRHARLILFNVERLHGELRSYGNGLKGRIRMLCNTAAMISFLPSRLCRFLVAHPELSVDLEERPSVEIALAIAGGRADLGIAADIVDLKALDTKPLVDDRLVVIARSGHRIAGQRSTFFADIASEPFVGVTHAALDTHLAEQAARLGCQLNYRTRLKRVRDVGMLVAAGVGVAVVSESAAAELNDHNLVVNPLADAWAYRQIYLCASDFRSLTPHANALVQCLTGV